MIKLAATAEMSLLFLMPDGIGRKGRCENANRLSAGTIDESAAWVTPALSTKRAGRLACAMSELNSGAIDKVTDARGK